MSSLLRHPAIVVVISLVALFYYLSLDKSARKAETSSETVAQLEGEVTQMQTEVTQLQQQLESANYPVAQEKTIRNELLLQKPGEYVLQLPDLEITETAQITQETPTPWQEWKKILF